jgi:hypothetical protein
MLVQASSTGDTSLLPLQPVLAGAVGVCGVLTVGLACSTARAWHRSDGPPGQRHAHSGLTLAGTAFVGQMPCWNVLAF